ncbi:MAG TPA: hypothetical protein DCE41_23610 [Cytophagales bacterium]|nr:hypothetical protein [Cytophagales bacterium]
MKTTTRWILDPIHSDIRFHVKYLMISTISGTFDSFTASMESPAHSFNDAQIRFSAKTNSVNTRLPVRDRHLRSEDFLHAESFPEISFSSTDFRALGEDGEFGIEGELTLRGTTQSVYLLANKGGMAIDRQGRKRVGFDLNGSISRSQFGVSGSTVIEGGSVLIGDDIHLDMSVQLMESVDE